MADEGKKTEGQKKLWIETFGESLYHHLEGNDTLPPESEAKRIVEWKITNLQNEFRKIAKNMKYNKALLKRQEEEMKTMKRNNKDNDNSGAGGSGGAAGVVF